MTKSQDPLKPYQDLVQQAWQTHTSQLELGDDILRPMLAHHFASSGKLLRPALTVAFFDQLQGSASFEEATDRPPSVIDASLAIELLHNGTLVHDDLQDGDETRRGHPTVWKQFDAYQAINVGSALYFYALRSLLRLSLPPSTIHHISLLLVEQAIAIIQGQAAEKTLWTQLDPTQFEAAKALYFDVVERKTSALFALPLMTAAILSGEAPETIAGLQEVARPLGALFQIQDDILDLYGDKGRETTGNDIAEGKPSLLVLHALSHTQPPHNAQRLQALLRAPREDTSTNDITWTIEHLKEIGSLQYCLLEVEHLHARARTHCESLSFKHKHHLPDFLDQLVHKILQPIQHLL